MHKHAVDRVVGIDETSYRFLPMREIGWSRRGVKQAQLQGNTRDAMTFTVAVSMDRGALDALVQIVHAGKTDVVLPGAALTRAHSSRLRTAGQRRRRSCSSRPVWTTASTRARKDNRGSFPGTRAASTPVRSPGPRDGGVPSSRAVLHPAAQHCVLAATCPSSVVSRANASAALARSVLDGSFDDVVMTKAWRRQSSAEWAARAGTDSAIKTRHGRLVGVACVPTATTISAMP